MHEQTLASPALNPFTGKLTGGPKPLPPADGVPRDLISEEDARALQQSPLIDTAFRAVYAVSTTSNAIREAMPIIDAHSTTADDAQKLLDLLDTLYRQYTAAEPPYNPVQHRIKSPRSSGRRPGDSMFERVMQFAAKILQHFGEFSGTKYTPRSAAQILENWVQLAAVVNADGYLLDEQVIFDRARFRLLCQELIHEAVLAAVAIPVATAPTIPPIPAGISENTQTTPDSNPKPHRTSVELFGSTECPKIRGVNMSPVNDLQYRLIELLCGAFPGSFKKSKIDAKLDTESWRASMKTLFKSNPKWEEVVIFPGRNGKNAGGYRIAPW